MCFSQGTKHKEDSSHFSYFYRSLLSVLCNILTMIFSDHFEQSAEFGALLFYSQLMLFKLVSVKVKALAHIFSVLWKRDYSVYFC